MTKSSKAKLAYMAQYQKSPENVEKRVERNKARRQALAAGIVHKGDGKEIDHKRPLDEGGSIGHGASASRACMGRTKNEHPT